MANSQRHLGFVVGGDKKSPTSDTVWKVRVKDPGSEFNGQKLIVASTHEDITLSRGLNVSFLIGSVDVAKDKRAQRAVDVMLA